MGTRGVVDPYCNGCIYRGNYNICDYLLVTGELRGCPAGKGCNKRSAGRKKRLNANITLKG